MILCMMVRLNQSRHGRDTRCAERRTCILLHLFFLMVYVTVALFSLISVDNSELK